MDTTPQWLKWAREIQSLGQIGLAFSDNHYEKARNKRIIEIASEIVEKYTALEKEHVQKVFMNQFGYATPKIDVRSAVLDEQTIVIKSEIIIKFPWDWSK